jgi:hypothetical protein
MGFAHSPDRHSRCWKFNDNQKHDAVARVLPHERNQHAGCRHAIAFPTARERGNKNATPSGFGLSCFGFYNNVSPSDLKRNQKQSRRDGIIVEAQIDQGENPEGMALLGSACLPRLPQSLGLLRNDENIRDVPMDSFTKPCIPSIYTLSYRNR